jgi:nicotinamidase-related amidase
MSDAVSPNAALLVIDVQESFRHRPYFVADDLATYLEAQNRLIEGAARAGAKIVQIFHVEDEGPFSHASDHVRAMAGLKIAPDVTFEKRRHSALVGSNLASWLTQNGIGRLLVSGIRTEQCCETTTRHASDLGWKVDFVSEATLTFPMTGADGKRWSAQEIRARTELVLAGRFARVLDVEAALASLDAPTTPAKAA